MSQIMRLDDVFEEEDQANEFELHSEPMQSAPVASNKSYDFALKFLLVGDSDVGKEEILQKLEDDGEENSENYRSSDVAQRQTSILLFGKRVSLHIWDAHGQGRFSSILNSYSRGTQGILLVFDITNKYSFLGLDRWIAEIDKHAPGVPKMLIGNRKHLAFRRQISEKQAKKYATKHNMAFLEVSPLCNFNVQESCAELSRLVLARNGMKDFWTSNTSMPSLQELCYRTIVSRVNAYDVESLPLPPSMKSYLKSWTDPVQSNYSIENQLETLKKRKSKSKSFSVKCSKFLLNCDKHRESRFKNLRRLLSFNSSASSPPHDRANQTTQSKRSNNNRHSCAIS